MRKRLPGNPLGCTDYGYFGTYDKNGNCIAVNIFPLAYQKELNIE